MAKLHFQGLLSFNPKPFLADAYKFHLLVDYGKKEFKNENINFNKEKVKLLLDALEKLILETENIIGKKLK